MLLSHIYLNCFSIEIINNVNSPPSHFRQTEKEMITYFSQGNVKLQLVCRAHRDMLDCCLFQLTKNLRENTFKVSRYPNRDKLVSN